MSQGLPSPPSGCPRWLKEGGKLAAAGAAGFGLAFLTVPKERPAPASHPPVIAPAPAPAKNPGSGAASAHALPTHLAASARVADAFELAGKDPNELRRRIMAAKEGEERQLLIRGLFDYLASHATPKDAIAEALLFSGVDQSTALRELAAAWLGTSPEALKGNMRNGSAVLQGGLALIQSPDAAPGAAEAWVEAFKNHPSRLELLSALAGRLTATDPQRAMALASGLTEWERRRFLDEVLTDWAGGNPASARKWMTDPANAANTAGRTFPWAAASYQNAEWVATSLSGETDPATRLDMVRGLAAAKAAQGTRDALAWADSLTNPAEREAAHDRIYEATPRGIGAVLSSEDGFPLVTNVLPDSASSRAGLQGGDRIVEVTGPDGKPVSLYQQSLETAVLNLRGEAGESVTLRVLRPGQGGVPVEQTIRVTRDQLVFPTATE
ncbi:MAG TPA: PDZ domain-containing protein [Verrucomicrobiales bacterium]|nr:PDZ domain-containing protein [Verrucomicrobiales bacterium]